MFVYDQQITINSGLLESACISSLLKPFILQLMCVIASLSWSSLTGSVWRSWAWKENWWKDQPVHWLGRETPKQEKPGLCFSIAGYNLFSYIVVYKCSKDAIFIFHVDSCGAQNYVNYELLG